MPLRRSLSLSLALGLAALSGCDAHAPPKPVGSEPGPVATTAGPLASTSAAAPASASVSTDAAELAQPPPPSPPIELHPGGKSAVRGEAGVVTSVEANATRVGVSVLKRGGNAVDAAVAVAYALAVTHPSAGNIGGGGFMIVRLANGETHAIDFRETAPASATPEKNKAQLDAGAIGWLSAATPGTVAGMSLALSKWGSMPLADLVQPAIDLAKKGHRMGAHQAQVLAWSWEKLKHDPEARRIYSKDGKEPIKAGALWKQPDLAKTLERIAKEGPKGFYEGPTAVAIDQAMRAHGGMVTLDDLKKYEAKERAPLRFTYRGFTVDTMPPPSMGGVAFADIMLTLERAKAYEAPLDSGLMLHLFIESSRRAYSERRLAGADPDFMAQGEDDKIVARLLGPEHIATRKPQIDPEKATASTELASDVGSGPAESPQTTHFSIIDAKGNAVSCTYTLSASFGAKVVAKGTGVLFSNAMGAFSYDGPNALAPDKRMASSMTPTIVSRGQDLELVLGSPGGDTIPNTVAQVMRNVVDYGMTIDDAVAHARVHEQWMPDKVRVEKNNPPPKAALDDLVKRGHVLDLEASAIGDANDALYDPRTGVAWAVADAREGGLAEGVTKKK